LRAQVWDGDDAEDRATEGASGNGFARSAKIGIGATLERNAKMHPGRATGVNQRVRIGKRDRQRLLDQHMFAGFRGCNALLSMLSTRRADTDGINVIACQQRSDIRLDARVEGVGECGRPFRMTGANRHQTRAGCLCYRLRMVTSSNPGANDAETDGCITHSVRLPDFRSSSNASYA
jgi:hypothetical protein